MLKSQERLHNRIIERKVVLNRIEDHSLLRIVSDSDLPREKLSILQFVNIQGQVCVLYFGVGFQFKTHISWSGPKKNANFWLQSFLFTSPSSLGFVLPLLPSFSCSASKIEVSGALFFISVIFSFFFLVRLCSPQAHPFFVFVPWFYNF